MKKAIISLIIFLITAVMLNAYTEILIIPQKDPVYSDLSYLCSTGLIKSATPEYLAQNAITKYEAASYISEASANALKITGTAEPAAAEGAKAVSKTAVDSKKVSDILEKYSKLYSAEISVLQKGDVVVPKATGAAPDPLVDLKTEVSDLEKIYSQTRFTETSAFKVTGVIAGRWQEYDNFGVSKAHYSSLDGTYLTLYAEGDLTDKIKFTSNITFADPHDDSMYGSSLVSIFGPVKPISPDVYAISLDIYGNKITTGFFWEDINSLVASQGQSERLGIFERDIYAGEESTKSHFETVFRNFSQNRDERWSKHQWNGLELYRDGLFGRDIFKIMGGKATYNYDYQYEYAAKYTHFQNFPFLKNGEWSLNAYNNSNDTREIGALPETTARLPDSLALNNLILGGDVKANAFNMFKINAEFERSSYKGSLTATAGPVPSFTQEGNAFFAHISPTFLPKAFDIVLRYTYIEPGYTAPASAVTDMNYRYQDPADPAAAVIKPITYAGDPTSLYNNMNKIEAHAYVNVPNGILMVNYGVSAQIQKTGSMFMSTHWLNSPEWGFAFNSNWGWANKPEYSGFLDYNNNRYNVDLSGSSDYPIASASNIIRLGKGGMSYDGSNREYMVSGAVSGETQKYLSNLMLLLRLELNKLVKLNTPLLLELYGEIIKLSNEADFLAWYDPDKLLAQNMASACLIYNVIPKMNIIGYFGLERWGANTVLPLPVDYLDTAYGLGIDFDLAGRAFLYLRLKNFYHNDSFVPANDLRGFKVWAELKSFF